MKTLSNRLITSVLAGIAIASIGICLTVLAEWMPHNVGMALALVGGALCFLLLDLLVSHPPMGLCFLLAVLSWSVIILAVRILLALRRRHRA
jgi:hypothetical protein